MFPKPRDSAKISFKRLFLFCPTLVSQTCPNFDNIVFCVMSLLPTQFTEIAWDKGEVHKAIKRMKVQNSADECGLVAEV